MWSHWNAIKLGNKCTLCSLGPKSDPCETPCDIISCEDTVSCAHSVFPIINGEIQTISAIPHQYHTASLMWVKNRIVYRIKRSR